MTQIFVGNLAYSTTERELRNRFECYGRVSTVRLALDRQSGKFRGFAFVGMPSWDDADEAITRLNGVQVSGRQIVVNEANQESQAPSQRSAVKTLWELI